MNDLIKRIAIYKSDPVLGGVLEEAADRIEQLQRENSELRFALADTEALELGTAERLTEAKKLIEQLWQIIDDIDTYGDMAKSDDKAFRALVERRQKDRWKTGITTDGYILNLDEAIARVKGEAK